MTKSFQLGFTAYTGATCTHPVWKRLILLRSTASRLQRQNSKAFLSKVITPHQLAQWHMLLQFQSNSPMSKGVLLLIFVLEKKCQKEAIEHSDVVICEMARIFAFFSLLQSSEEQPAVVPFCVIVQVLGIDSIDLSKWSIILSIPAFLCHLGSSD